MRAIVRRAAVLAAAALTATVSATIATGPTALAFSTSSVATIGGAGEGLFVAGAGSQPTGNLTISFADNASSHVWSTSDNIKVQLWDATTGSALSNTSANAFEGASFSGLPTVTATNSVDSSFYGIVLAKGATSTVNDEFVLSFKKDAKLDTQTTKFTVSGIKITLGSRIPAGHQIQLKLTASNGTPFAGASATAAVGIGLVPATSVSTSTVATGAPMASGVSLGKLTVKDVTGGATNSGDEIDLTLTGGFFSATGTMAGNIPSGTTPIVTTIKNTSDSLKLTASKTSVVNDTLTLTGAKVVLPATAGEVYLVANDKTTSTILGAVGVATVVTQARAGGIDRYFTASQLFDIDFSSATSAVLTSGANYPDALSAIYLAGQLSTGVLTTDPNTLPTGTRTELLTRAIKTVYIVGGTAAVSASVASQVASFHVANNSSGPLIQVVRIAGVDRYATNKAVDTFLPPGVTTTAIIATGENFADALAVGPAVYRTGEPLILTPGTTLSPAAKATIGALGITHAVIVGGTSAVSAGVESALAAAGVNVDYRIAGSERTETAAQVAAWDTDGLAGHDVYPAIGSLGFTGTTRINVARGDNFADALAAGAVAGADQSVIVLTSGPTTLGPGIPEYFANRAGVTTTLRALGQTSALSATTLNVAATTLTEPLSL